ncbi:MAG: hypothetical protein DRN68_06080 [Thaumarchaeota archaeon]|nr:MAG: hypothetical protein DRN68_06080 [Nitrososphaerota archaeon]
MMSFVTLLGPKTIIRRLAIVRSKMDSMGINAPSGDYDADDHTQYHAYYQFLLVILILLLAPSRIPMLQDLQRGV